ncbi:hypothetical protein EI555_013080, partial [Monodon monoceros]
PAAGGGGGLFLAEFKEILGQICHLFWSERSSRSLAQVSLAAASVLTEEVWKEEAGRKRLEAATPAPSFPARQDD